LSGWPADLAQRVMRQSTASCNCHALPEECYVSTVEIAVPALSPEKKADTLVQLKNWLRIHADQMPLIAYMDAMNRTKKLTDGLGPAELGLLLLGSQPFFALSNDAPHSVEDLIAMQMRLASYKSAVDKLAAHHLKITDDLKKIWQDS
jgi:hypothetical protein